MGITQLTPPPAPPKKESALGVGGRDRLNEQGLNTIVSLQRFEKLAGAMRFFSVFGDDSFFMFLIALGYWWIDEALSAQLATALVLSTALAGLLKLAFHQPRPYWLDSRVRALSTSHDYGLPSRHVLNATLTFGILLWRAPVGWQAVALAGGLVLVALVALSRMYIGVHFPLDVVVGFGIGLLGLWLYGSWGNGLSAWWSGLGVWPQIGAAFLASALYLGLVKGILAFIAGTPDPAQWWETASAGKRKLLSPRNLTYHVATAGGLLGLGVAFALAEQWQAAVGAEPGWALLARLVIGLIGAAALWFGLERVPLNKELWTTHVYGYVHHALVVIWLFFLAPVVFGVLKI